MKKKFVLLLCAAMLLTSLAGCGTNGDVDTTPTPDATPTGTPEAVLAHDWDAAHAYFEPDEIVMTVDGSDVTWEEYFYWLYYSISYMEQHIGTTADFTAVSLLDAEQNYNEFYTDSALSLVIQYHALDVNSKAMDVELTEEDEQYLVDLLASDITSVLGEDGTEEAFYEYLDGIYVSKELYNYINRVSVLYNRTYENLYGEQGEKLTDEEVMAFVDENGFMTAKHILISTMDEEGVALADDLKAEKLTKAEDILAQIKIASADIETTFDEFMNEHSEDTGLAYYPNGYCFGPDKMVAEFEEATAALEDYGLSEIVESTHGYHIILRLPTLPTNIVEYYSEQVQYDLRYVASSTMYEQKLNEWTENAEVVWTEKFENLNLNDIFGIKTATE